MGESFFTRSLGIFRKTVSANIGNISQKRKFAFTIAELIVVIAILAILATIGFLTLQGYTSDAKDSALRANIRSVYSAITSESAITGNSPRYYVIHDTGASLTGATVYVDGFPLSLSGGNWDVAGTNYSAGNPDYAKLKLNPEKFKTSSVFDAFLVAKASYDAKYLTVGAVDLTPSATPGKKIRTASWIQVMGTNPLTQSVVLTGNYPGTVLSGSIAGLIKSPDGTGAALEGSVTTNIPPAPTQGNPSNLVLSHSTRSKTFTISWTGGFGNGGSCKLQYFKNAATWTDVAATTYNCDANVATQSVTLPADGWYSGNWNGTQIRIVRTSDTLAVGTFPSTLACSTAGASASSTPTVDEDCNGYWDDTATSTVSGCGSGESCYKGDKWSCDGNFWFTEYVCATSKPADYPGWTACVPPNYNKEIFSGPVALSNCSTSTTTYK